MPELLEFTYACVIEPCCVAHNSVVENSRIKPGDRVVVLGPGTIRILCASGKLDVKPLIGGVWPLEEWHEAFEKMHDESIVKCVESGSIVIYLSNF